MWRERGGVVAKVSDSVRIREALEDAIVEGEFKPGQRLDPTRIAQDFDCSRTPVREALQALERSGLVQVRPKQGTFVVELSIAELAERFEVMAELEGMSARLAARTITRESLAELFEVLEECERFAAEDDSDGYYEANARFHGILYDSSGNSFLQQQMYWLRRSLQPYRRIQLKVPNRMRRSLAEHRAIARAVADGAAIDAEDLARQHVQVQVAEFGQLVKAWESVRATSAR